MNKNARNKISTAGYFIKRLKDNGFITHRIFSSYANSDPRRWTILIEPGKHSVYVTCYENKEALKEILFEINDGGRSFPKNYSIKTSSIEVIITTLLSRGISPSIIKERKEHGQQQHV